jgi:hypothetical protein
MANEQIERADPIPPGVYWLDLTRNAPSGWFPSVNDVDEAKTAEAHRQFEWWRGSFSPSIVHVIRSDGNFVLFRVDRPAMRWGVDAGLGLPNRATERMRDVAQVPDPEPGLAWRFPSFEGMGTGLAVVAALYLLSRK